MTSLPLFQTVECKTIDGIALEAWFYAVEGPAPAIVMTHGVSLYDYVLVSSAQRSLVQLRQRNEPRRDSRRVPVGRL